LALFPRAKQGAEKGEEHVAAAESRVDCAAISAGTEVPAYPKTGYFSRL
jgi:hypothetical protein